MILGLPFTDATFSAGTMMTAAAPSPMGDASNKLIGVATMLDFSNWSTVIFWCKRANGLWMAFACALMEKGAKSTHNLIAEADIGSSSGSPKINVRNPAPEHRGSAADVGL